MGSVDESVENVMKGVPNPAKDIGGSSMLAYRAPSLLQPHFAKQALKDAHDGKIPPLIGFYCGLPSPPIAKIAASLGADLVWIDWEHAAMGVETMTQMVHDIQFMSEGRSHALVRVPGHAHENIGFALDAGASIVIPQVDTVEQAKHIVSAAKFGSRLRKVPGTRSAPPGRWMPGYTDMSADPNKTLWMSLNDQAAIIIQIETLEGINNLDDILTAVGEHIDSVWLGTLDCRVSMGLPGMFGDEPEWKAALKTYNAALRKHNQPSSGFALGTPEMMVASATGKSFIMAAADIFSLIQLGDVILGAKKAFHAENKKDSYEKHF